MLDTPVRNGISHQLESVKIFGALLALENRKSFNFVRVSFEHNLLACTNTWMLQQHKFLFKARKYLLLSSNLYTLNIYKVRPNLESSPTTLQLLDTVNKKSIKLIDPQSFQPHFLPLLFIKKSLFTNIPKTLVTSLIHSLVIPGKLIRGSLRIRPFTV